MSFNIAGSSGRGNQTRRTGYGGILMKTHAIIRRPLTSYPYNTGPELCRDFAGQPTLHKADTLILYQLLFFAIILALLRPTGFCHGFIGYPGESNVAHSAEVTRALHPRYRTGL